VACIRYKGEHAGEQSQITIAAALAVQWGISFGDSLVQSPPGRPKEEIMMRQAPPFLPWIQ
jgi:hypothetical protein